MNEIINKTDGTILKPTTINQNEYFWLLYSDNKNNYSFTPTTNFIGKLFMIGGGGAGGYYFGGGGGAGAAYHDDNYPFYSGVTYNFSIGNGGKCDIDDFNSLFSKGLSLNIYNNVNIDFNNISFSLDDYSSLNINNSGLIQSFIVNNYDTNITIPSSIWNNNTFYIWSGYIIPTGTDEYIKININTNINTAIWVDNYIYKNDNALILNTNNNYLSEVKIIKIDPKRYYNIKIIAYCNSNSSNNNFNISFSNNCSLANYDKKNEKYIYLNATDTTLSFNKTQNSIETLICKGGGNGGCGFFNQNNNLDGGCGGGSGINKKNGKTVMNTSVYKGTDGAVGAFCGGGGGISSSGKDKVGGDGMILDWFDQKLFFGCGGNGGNYKDNRNYGYGCGGNGGDCCYYSKEIINNNGKNGCVIIYINTSQIQPTLQPTLSPSLPPTLQPTLPPIIEKFSNNNNIGEFYNYISDNKQKLKIREIFHDSISYITNCTFSVTNIGTFQGIGKENTRTKIISKNISDAENTYAGFYCASTDTNAPTTSENGKYGTDGTEYKDGKDKFFNYFKYNPSYIYNILALHKCIIALYKIVYYELDKSPYDTNFNKITLVESTNGASQIATEFDRSNNNIILNNIFKISSDIVTADTNTDKTAAKDSLQYKNKFYGYNASASSNGADALFMNQDYVTYNYNNANSIYPNLPYYHTINSDDNKIKDLTYIKDYLDNDFTNLYNNLGLGNTSSLNYRCYDKNFITRIPELSNEINLNNVIKAYNRIANEVEFNVFNDDNRHNKELQLIYLTIFRDVLDPNSKSKIAGRLFYYAHYFNLIIINLNLQYGLYRLLFTRFNRKYIHGLIQGTDTTYYFTKSGALSSSSEQTGTLTSTILDTYNNDKLNSVSIINEIYNTFNDKFKVKDVNADVYITNRNNNIASNRVVETQLKLNKIIKKYNDELQIYNTTLNIYKAVIVISIVLLIVIIYIFTIDSNVLNHSSKISLFIILGLLLLGISVYFIYNNNLVYENFTDNKDDIIETFTSRPTSGNAASGVSNANDVENKGVDFINDCHMAQSLASATITSHYVNFKNSYNDYNIFTTSSGVNYNKNYQGYITNFIYLAGYINYNYRQNSVVRPEPIDFLSDIYLDGYSSASKKYYDYLRLYVASVFNVMTNSSNSIDDIDSIIKYKNKRNDFYENRYNFYLNSIEALKNEKYVYYYLSILYFLCVVLLLISLIIILIFGHSINAIIITSVLSFLIALIIVYYIYFKLHHHTRLKINKNYWAYNNPSNSTISDLSN